MKKILLLCFVAICMVRAGNSQTITNWGHSVQGVQMAITMTNSVFQVGAQAAVLSVTKNLSTEVVKVDISAPTINFDVILTSSTGKLYHVTTPTAIGYPTIFRTINPEEERSESIPVTFGKTRFGDTVEPGDYTLKATRHFSMNGKDFELVSNLLKVQVK